MAELNIGMVQMCCEKGALEENLAAIKSHLKDAARQNIDIICFPEGSITGYVDPARYPEAVLSLESPAVARFVEMTSEYPITALAGIIEANPAGKPFITQIVAEQGTLQGFYRKRVIPDDEAHLFAPGSDAAVFSHPKVTFGLAICADIDAQAVFADCARNGAQLVFEAAAPGLYGEQATRDWQAGYDWWRGGCMTKLARYAREEHIYIAVATQAGRTRDEDFPGGGYLFGPDGCCLAESTDWSEGVLSVQVALSV
ncbi:MAG TPA: carbon-nitrogen hydrolase family protein [Ktedonobacterales bacterium]|jgi:predicted amidohydrolase